MVTLVQKPQPDESEAAGPVWAVVMAAPAPRAQRGPPPPGSLGGGGGCPPPGHPRPAPPPANGGGRLHWPSAGSYTEPSGPRHGPNRSSLWAGTEKAASFIFSGSQTRAR